METKTIDAIALTRELVRFNTINPPGNERSCAEFLGELLEKHGFSVRYHAHSSERYSLIASIGGSAEKPPLCFTGHLDTVPLGGKAWTVDPLGGDVIDGKIYGRGTSDMKAGVAAFVAAAIEVAPQLATGPGVVLVITADEETGCSGAFDLAEVDGLLGDAGVVVVAEPTSNYPCVGHKGVLWLKAIAKGTTAHASMPELGDNAIYKAARAISKLEDFDFNIPRHEVMGKPTLNVGVVQGGININSVPDHAEVSIDIRTIAGQDNVQLTQHIAQYLGDEVEVTPTLSAPSIWTEPQDAWIQSVFAVMSEIHGKAIETKTMAYFTDASALTPAYGNVPTIILGPGEGGQAHQTDEYCFVQNILDAVEAYKQICLQWVRV